MGGAPGDQSRHGLILVERWRGGMQAGTSMQFDQCSHLLKTAASHQSSNPAAASSSRERGISLPSAELSKNSQRRPQ